MFIRYFLLILNIVFINCFHVKSQDYKSKTILIYATENDYLLPFIENTLIDLNKNYKSDKQYFDNVINLNRIQSSITDGINLRENIEFFRLDQSSFGFSNEAKEMYSNIVKGLSSHNLFLKIKINKLGNFLDYQFTLYESIKLEENDLDGNILSVHSIENPKVTTSDFIDVSDKEYKKVLKQKLISLFPETNRPPTTIAKSNFSDLVNGDTLYCSVMDSVLIDLSFTDDDDTPREEFRFNWRQIDLLGNININLNKRIKLKISNSPRQVLKFPEKGIYKVGYFVSDGISSSREDTIVIKVLEKPRLNDIDEKSRVFISQLKEEINISASNYQIDELELVIESEEDKNILLSGISYIKEHENFIIKLDKEKHPLGILTYKIFPKVNRILGEPFILEVFNGNHTDLLNNNDKKVHLIRYKRQIFLDYNISLSQKIGFINTGLQTLNPTSAFYNSTLQLSISNSSMEYYNGISGRFSFDVKVPYFHTFSLGSVAFNNEVSNDSLLVNVNKSLRNFGGIGFTYYPNLLFLRQYKSFVSKSYIPEFFISASGIFLNSTDKYLKSSIAWELGTGLNFKPINRRTYRRTFFSIKLDFGLFRNSIGDISFNNYYYSIGIGFNYSLDRRRFLQTL